MVGYDRRHDRETEAGAALFARIVGLEDAGAQARVDTGAVVGDLESDYRNAGLRVAGARVIGAAKAPNLDSRAVAVMRDGGRGGDRVIEQVDQRALHRLAIDWDQRNRRVQRNLELNIGIGFAKIGDGLVRERVDIAGHRIQMRHPRERGELVDQGFQILNLANNDAGAFLDQSGFGAGPRAELAA